MKDTIVKIGVVGTGLFGSRHARVLAGIPRCKVMAVADTDMDKARRLGEELNVIACNNVHELLEACKVDALVIALPDALHLEPALAGIGAGCHILLEKPMATTLPDATLLYRAAQDRKQVFMMGHIMRWDPRYIEVAAALRQRTDETVLNVSVRKGLSIGSALHQLPGTNLVYHVAVHDIDALRFMTGLKITEVYATATQQILRQKQLHDHLAVICKLSNGALFTINAGWVLPAGTGTAMDVSWNLVTDRRSFYIDIQNGGLRVLDGAGFQYPDGFRYQQRHGVHAGFIREMDEHFIDCILTGAKPIADFEDGWISVLICDSILKSIKTGTPQIPQLLV